MLEINTKETAQKMTDWIKQTVATAGFCNVVIGVSGGVDSAVAAMLAAQAVGKENIFLVMMPYGKSGKEAVEDAMLVAKKLQLPKNQIISIDIKKSVDAIWAGIGNSKQETKPTPTLPYQGGNIKLFPLTRGNERGFSSSVRKGNVMARVRMIYLFDLAKKLKGLVCGTENRTEHYLGYFTRFGDAASDIEPMRSLYKTQMWEMAKYLEIHKKIIINAPTAGLWENQTDEGELGFTYSDADKILYYYFDEKLSADKIVAKGILKDIVVKVLERVAKNDFKHHLPFVYR